MNRPVSFKIFIISVGCSLCLPLLFLLEAELLSAQGKGGSGIESKGPFKVGWVSALTGPASRYAAHKAAILAVEEINAKGGIRGRPLKLVMEDGRCEGAATASAAQKLLYVDKVKFILGGHCSTETLTLAPLAEKSRVLLLASVSTSPLITNAGEYIFRTSPVSTVQSDLVAEHLVGKGISRLAIVYEDTEYAGPIADRLKEQFRLLGGSITTFEHYDRGQKDFRSILLKLRNKKPEAVFLSVQSPENAFLLAKQIRELGMELPLYGNEIVGNSPTSFPQSAELLEGLIFGEPGFEQEANPRTQQFISRYSERFQEEGLPMGFWTAESYDAVMLLAELLNRCGADVERVRACLLEVENYEGASGLISIDKNGDGIRKYQLKQIRKGRSVVL